MPCTDPTHRRARDRKRMREWYHTLTRAGLCRTCKAPVCVESSQFCSVHLERTRATRRAWWERRKAARVS